MLPRSCLIALLFALCADDCARVAWTGPFAKSKPWLRCWGCWQADCLRALCVSSQVCPPLQEAVLDDFKILMGQADVKLAPDALDRLAAACLVVEALGPKVGPSRSSCVFKEEAGGGAAPTVSLIGIRDWL